MPSHKAKTLKFLDKIKWFGLRKIYYLGKNHFEKKELQKNLIQKKLSQYIIENYDGYEGQNADLKNGRLGFGLLHYSLIQNLKPKNILVVGSLKGYIPVIAAMACRDNQFGQVDFVDAAYDDEEKGKNWQGIGLWKKINPKEYFSKVGVQDYIKTHVMTTAEFAKKYPKKKYQYIYIDGDHSYEGVKLDYSLFYPRLEKNGLMSFHDIVASGKLAGGLYGVKKFWQELKNKEKIIFPFPTNSGLGILQKK
jgi:predicted O-methyltransferase YrrM